MTSDASFALFLKLLAPIPVIVGLLHVSLGAGTEVLLGASVAAESLKDPVLDSQNRFYGAIFMAYGPLLYLCAQDLRRHALLLRIVGGFVFAGGLARLVSVALLGLPSTPVVGLIVIEVIGIPLLLAWHARVLRKPAPG
jgi:hypothetical protein